LSDSFPELQRAVSQNGLLFFAKKLVPQSIATKTHNPKTVVIPDSIYHNYNLSSTNNTCKIKSFSPTKIRINTNTDGKALLVLQQSYYYGWNVFIDNVQSDIISSNYLYMSVFVPEGSHEVIFTYENNAVKYAFIISISLFIILLILIVAYFKSRNYTFYGDLSIVILLLFSLYFLSGRILHNTQFHDNKYHTIKANLNKEDTPVISYTSDANIDSIVPEKLQWIHIDPDNQKTLGSFIDSLSDCKYSKLILYTDRNYSPDYIYIQKILSTDFGTPNIIYKNQNTNITKYEFRNNSINVFDWYNYAERKSDNWTDGKSLTDSTANMVFICDSVTAFSSTLKLTGKELENKSIIIARVKVKCNKGDCQLVYSRNNSGQQLAWSSSKYSDFFRTDGKWHHLYHVINLDKQLKDTDEFKIYIWNTSKELILADEFEITVN